MPLKPKVKCNCNFICISFIGRLIVYPITDKLKTYKSKIKAPVMRMFLMSTLKGKDFEFSGIFSFFVVVIVFLFTILFGQCQTCNSDLLYQHYITREKNKREKCPLSWHTGLTSPPQSPTTLNTSMSQNENAACHTKRYCDLILTKIWNWQTPPPECICLAGTLTCNHILFPEYKKVSCW